MVIDKVVPYMVVAGYLGGIFHELALSNTSEQKIHQEHKVPINLVLQQCLVIILHISYSVWYSSLLSPLTVAS